MKRYFVVLLAFCIVVTAFAGGGAQSVGGAATFPTRPIQFVAPVGAGSQNDVAVRIMAPFLEKQLGQPVVVTNEPAANGVVFVTRLAKDIRPDGYTLSYANIMNIASNAVLGEMRVDISKELTHLAIVTEEPSVIVAGKNGRYKTLVDLVNDAKARPGQVSFGVAGQYSMDGMVALGLEQAAGIKLNINGSLGSTQGGMTAIMGGHLDSMADGLLGSLQFYLDDAIEIIGIGGSERAPELPNVPTYKEQGWPIVMDSAQRSIFTRAGAPQEALDVLYAAVKAMCEDPAYIAECKRTGLRNVYKDHVEAHRVVDSQVATFQEYK